MTSLEELTVGRMLRRTAEKHPGRPAMQYKGRTWTYAQLDAQADLAARRLLALGLKKGDHLGLWCEAEPNAIFLLYGAVRAGIVTAMINTSLHGEELKNLIQDSDITYLAAGDGFKELDYPAICASLSPIPGVRGILYAGQRKEVPPGMEPFRGRRASRAALERAEEAVTPRDPAYMLYTSGTTSRPKAVMGTHYSRANCGVQQAIDLGASKEDKFLVAMPIFHCFCLSVNIMAACSVGACIYLPASRRTQCLLEAISGEGCTVLSCVPALYHAIISRPDFKSWDTSSLRTGFIGGSIYLPSLFEEIDGAFGPQFTLLSSLGQTEATGGLTTASFSDSLEVRATTVGHFMTYLEGSIRDGDNRPLPTGRTGEICVRGYVVMEGYYKLPEATAQTVDAQGWLHTGDMGYLDEAGNLHVTGRLKDLIIRGGENISPAEIEALVGSDQRVSLCKAVGVPDHHYGEEVCLCLTLKEGCRWDRRDIRAFLQDRLADFKVPRYILFMDDLPKTLTGKVKGAELKKLARAALDL